MCTAVARSLNEWEAHPHREALRNAPPLEIIRRGGAPKRRATCTPAKPLGGLKVLDLTRVLAGPICGRTLAEYGADVTWITSPYLPNLPLIDADTSRGKRALSLDLTAEEDQARLKTLVEDCHVFLQAYRPGGLAAKGFGVEELMKIRPGIVCANITAYGYEGPWKDRRGVCIGPIGFLLNVPLSDPHISSIHWSKLQLALSRMRQRHIVPFPRTETLPIFAPSPCKLLIMQLPT
jgi:hypothetical protein